METMTAHAAEQAIGRKSRTKKPLLDLTPSTQCREGEDNEVMRALLAVPAKMRPKALTEIELMLHATLGDLLSGATEEELTARFAATPALQPMTISDCMFAYDVLGKISAMRSDVSDGAMRDRVVALVAVALDYFELRMGSLPFRSEEEAAEFVAAYLGEYESNMSEANKRRMLLNLAGQALRASKDGARGGDVDHPQSVSVAVPVTAVASALSNGNEELRKLILLPASLDEQQLGTTEKLIDHLVAQHMVEDEFMGGREDLIACFDRAGYLTPQTLSDCVYAHRALGRISIARRGQPASPITTRGANLCDTARQYFAHCMGKIPLRSAEEAREVYEYYVLEYGFNFEDAYDEPILRNLLLSPYRSAEPAPVAMPAPGPASSEPPGYVFDLVCCTHETLERIEAMATATRALLTTPTVNSVVIIDRMLQEISVRADACSDDVDGLAESAGVALHYYRDEVRAKQLSRVQLRAKGESAQLGA